ncbi:unnamed protein product, partial [Effrenium voratum]
QITDDFVETKLKKMVSSMREYGDANRVTNEGGVKPDGTVVRLKEDAEVFRGFVQEKNYKKAMDALEKYRVDIPFGIGVFEWDDDLDKLVPD